MSLFYRFFRVLFFVFFRVFNRLEVKGYEHVPEAGGVIVAANHISYLDPPVVGAALRRRPTFMAKQGLFKVPLLGIFVKCFSFPVRRKKPQPSSIKEAVKRLNKGELVVIFPEGGLTDDGSTLNVKRGVGVIAAMSKAPIVPALITGTDRALAVGSKVIRPEKITVTFGRPIEIREIETDKLYQDRLCSYIMEEIKKLETEN